MAYDKARELLDLGLTLAASHYGLNADEIEALLAGDRKPKPSPQALQRQRQRMLINLDKLFGNALEQSVDDDGRPRWRMRARDLVNMPLVDSADLAAIERAADFLASRGDRENADRLARIRDSLQVALDSRKRAGIEVDFEALREAQAIVSQPGPQIAVDPQIERAISQAILAGTCLEFDYRGADGAASHKSVEPVGVLLGPRKYLVARSVNSPQGSEASHWRLDRMKEPNVVNRPARAMPAGYTLASHARRCFGVFWNEQEYQEVEWRFAKRAAASVTGWQFHPDQVLERNEDGTVTVRFRASGQYEMAWHLYQWGDAVEVIAPRALADLVEGHRRSDFRILP